MSATILCLLPWDLMSVRLDMPYATLVPKQVDRDERSEREKETSDRVVLSFALRASVRHEPCSPTNAMRLKRWRWFGMSAVALLLAAVSLGTGHGQTSGRPRALPEIHLSTGFEIISPVTDHVPGTPPLPRILSERTTSGDMSH